MMIRRIIVGLAALSLAIVAVRNAAVQSLVASNLDTAQAVWASHPKVEIAQGQRDIAIAAGARKPMPAEAFARIRDAAVKMPLEPEPFIVRGIQRDLAGSPREAELAFLAARQRDPRSLPARYFLASTRLRAGNIAGLHDAAAMSRMVPGGAVAVAPYLAAFSRQERSWPAMRAMFRDYPEVRDAVLTSLAADRANLPQVVALGGIASREQAPWLGVMVDTLVASGDLGQARALWARSAKLDRNALPLLFDANFKNGAPPPPFNWALTSSTVGIAERQSGRLHVIFYGQSDGPLARQLLTLSPGAYRLSAPAGNGSGETSQLRWTVRCTGDKGAEFASAPVAAQGLDFAVPAGCAGQWLELAGRAGDVGSETEIRIGPLALGRAGSR